MVCLVFVFVFVFSEPAPDNVCWVVPLRVSQLKRDPYSVSSITSDKSAG